jgi:hypothetical protein
MNQAMEEKASSIFLSEKEKCEIELEKWSKKKSTDKVGAAIGEKYAKSVRVTLKNGMIAYFDAMILEKDNKKRRTIFFIKQIERLSSCEESIAKEPSFAWPILQLIKEHARLDQCTADACHYAKENQPNNPKLSKACEQFENFFQTQRALAQQAHDEYSFTIMRIPNLLN